MRTTPYRQLFHQKRTTLSSETLVEGVNKIIKETAAQTARATIKEVERRKAPTDPGPLLPHVRPVDEKNEK